MKSKSTAKSGFIRPTNLLGALLLTVGVSLAVVSVTATPNTPRKFAKATPTTVAPKSPTSVDATPPSGTLDPNNRTLTYTDGPTAPNPTGILGAPICSAPNSCSDFVVTINASSLAATHNVTWEVQWTPANVDLDIFVEDAAGNLIANNNSTADPSAIILPIPPNGTVWHFVVAASVGTAPLNGSVSLAAKFPASPQGAGAPPRYMNYPAGTSQANGDNEPSMGVDWNPNVPGLREIAGQTRKNTGGVAFFTGDTIQWRSNFDDCSSPAINVWEDMNAPIVTGLDPIGFVDHFTTAQLGLNNTPPHTPGRVFGLDLAAGTSTAAFSDDDGQSWTALIAGNYPAGPDHETLGGGPFHAPIPTPPAPAYPNAIYYCSQNGVQNAECSRSDDGGLTYGPGVPIFDPTVCGGGIHGHVKVSPQGTAYVPNSSCGEGNPVGTNGVATTTNNGITWEERNVPNSTGSQDPAIGIGLNNVGKPAGQVPNTIYVGWIAADGHAHIAHSGDEGVTWQDDKDISSIVGSEHAVFPIVVAGDDNRAAYAFLGTVKDFYPKKIWHLFIATTYDGGKNWILVDATPNDPVQIGDVCLLGIGCNGSRNLLDFNGIDVDREGRVLVGYTDGCVNCSNTQNITQSSQGHGTIARQAGGRRLFSAFDPVEPAPPAAPQVLSATRQNSTNVLISWLVPDNGGSPITGYNIYRSSTSGAETFLAHVNGELTDKYLDQAAPSTSNWFYKVMAVNAIGESTYCHELNVNGVQPAETACQLPYLTMQTDASGDQFGAPNANAQLDIQRVAVGEPFINCTDKSITFLMKVNNLNPTPAPNGAWRVVFDVKDTTNTTRTVYVQMDTQLTPTPEFEYGYRDGTSDTTQFCPNTPGFTCPVSGSTTPDGTIIIRLNTAAPLDFFSSTNTTSTPDFTVAFTKGTVLTGVKGQTVLLVGAAQTGQLVEADTTGADKDYTTVGNLSCLDVRPTAVVTANPMSGNAPLSVTFSGAASSTANPCTTIAAYTLDFGDGSAPVTRTVAQFGANASQFSHTYHNTGDYAARLTVADSAGQASDAAKVVVSVGTGQVQLVGVVSRKVHGTTPYDFTLPNNTIGVECRGPGDSANANVDYQLVFVFPNTLSSVGSPSATATGGSQPNQPTGAIGTDTHEYVVNLTGVPNAQYLTVTLNNVHDSTGATGNVSITMGVLRGDVNGNGVVNSTDTSLVQAESGKPLTVSNYRRDVNANGAINSTDTSIVQSKSGTGLPPAP